jgi:hypothetical protein
MRRLVPVRLAALAAVAAFALAGRPAPAADPFYLDLLRQGLATGARGQHAEAARLLRLAAFGMLEEPPLLAQALVHLALAQVASGDAEGFQQSIRRLSEVETRFQAYARADLAPDLRAALEGEIARRVPPAALRLDPAFARLAAAPTEAAGAGRRQRRRPAAPAGAAPAPAVAHAADPPPAVAAPDPPQTAGPAATPPTASHQNPGPATGSAPSEAQARLARARELLDQARVASDLAEAMALARQVADAEPGNREAQHLAARIAYRASNWSEAAAYFERGGVPADPVLRFYMAVALFEAGNRARAAEVLRPALPGLRRTPFVDAWVSKILGAGGGYSR